MNQARVRDQQDQRETVVGHFSITGKALTRIARDGMLSDRPGWAFRLLKDGLCGPGSADTAMNVLDGKARLEGDETVGLDVVPDRSTQYLKELRFIYAGRIQLEGRWWRPRGIVRCFCEADADYAAKKVGCYPSRLSDRSTFEKWSKKRVEFYVGETCPMALLDIQHDDGTVVWETCGEPPQWWKTSVRPEEALAAFLECGRNLVCLDEVEHSRSGYVDGIERKTRTDGVVGRISKMQAERDKEDERRHKVYLAECVEIGSKVRAKAGSDTFVLDVSPEGKTGEREIIVPRAPFLQWALRRTSLKHLAPPWTCVAPSGMKMANDDPFHTDWLLGAGCSANDAYDGPVKHASWREMFRLHEELGHFACAVVVYGGEVTGKIGEEIVVVPDLSPERLADVANARGIITERGGQLAHLAVVAREGHGGPVTIMRVEDATTRYPAGTAVTLRPSKGEIETRVVSR